MNILLLCHEYPPLGGGGGVGAKQYAEAWAQKGNHVTVLTSWRRGPKFKEIQNGVRIVRVITIPSKDRATFSFVSMFSYIVSGFVHILWNIHFYRKNHIINSHFCIPTGLLAFIVSKLLCLPNVLTIIGGDIYDPTKKSSPHRHFITRVLNSFLMNSADRLVAISSDTKVNAEGYYKVRKKISVINYGFYPPELKANDLPKESRKDGKYRVIAVGRLIPRKGFEYLIQAMARLPENIVVSIVGDGPLEEQLKSVTEKHNLNGRVNFVGYVSREKIYRHLKAANLFVLSSLHEGLGIVVQEAMHVGLPIVSTDNGGQVDIISDPHNGILVKPKDVEALASAIYRFYDNREFAEKVGVNNKEDIKKFYIVANSEHYIKMFEELVEEPAPSKRFRRANLISDSSGAVSRPPDPAREITPESTKI